MTTPAGTETQMAGEPVPVWAYVDFQPNGSFRTLYALRGRNNAADPARVKLTLGRGANLTENARVLQPGTEETIVFATPVDLRSQEFSIATEGL